jgi:hypothetical protein
MPKDDKVRALHAITNLMRCLYEMCGVYKTVDVLERYDNFMKVRVPRLDKSIGYVFGEIEGMKSKFDVSEYSVSQTTLEQIF